MRLLEILVVIIVLKQGVVGTLLMTVPVQWAGLGNLTRCSMAAVLAWQQTRWHQIHRGPMWRLG
jgi:hypothetical protein